jgi:hypothetical protein
MNRIGRYLKGTAATLLIAAAPALCAELFFDDFTDAAASHVKWANLDQSTMNHSVSGGSCTLDNSASQYIGEYKHEFGANKPAVFTLSYLLKSKQGSNIAGALFCRQSDSRSGYILTLNGDNVAVYKVTATSTSINADPIFYQKSFDLKPADNKLTVSKSGSTFNVFANDVFAGSFTDASYGAGDLSFVMFNGTKAVFGETRVTDVFTTGSPRTSFSDDFNGNGLKYWRNDFVGSGPIEERDGNMIMTASANGGVWPYIDIDLTDFEAVVEVRHLSGPLTSPYGIFIKGTNAATEMINFAILGGRYYAAWKSTDPSYTPVSNSKILGSAGDAPIILIDTLVIRKKAGSSNYEFLANGEPLAINLGQVNFSIKSIGLFCESGVSVAFDNFHVEQTGSNTSILRDGNKKPAARKPSPVITGSRAFYDLRGRKRYIAATQTRDSRATVRTAGMYVNKNERDVVVRKGKAARD